MSHCKTNAHCFVRPVEFDQFLEDLYKQWMDRETWCAVEKSRKLAQRRHYDFSNASRKSDLFACSSRSASFSHRDSNRPVYFPGERRQFPEQKNRSHLSRYMP